MNTINPLLPGYQFAEYLLVLNPHEELQHKIFTVKQTLKEKYKTAVPANKSHITLVQFYTWQMMEDKIKQRLQMIAMGTTPYKIELKDYGSFPSHTIYITVNTKNVIQRLVKELRTARRLMKSPDKNPQFIMEPHIPVARKLNAVQFKEAWTEYAHRHFTGSFIADSMLLLKKKAGDSKYQIVQRFEFMNLPVNVKQGELFS